MGDLWKFQMGDLEPFTRVKVRYHGSLKLSLSLRMRWKHPACALKCQRALPGPDDQLEPFSTFVQVP